MQEDKILGPASISEGAMKAVRATIELLAKNSLISSEDSKKALAILEVNPHRRLGLLGKRLARIQADVSEIRSISMGLDNMAEECQKELDLLRRLIEWQPEWRPNEPNSETTTVEEVADESK